MQRLIVTLPTLFALLIVAGGPVSAVADDDVDPSLLWVELEDFGQDAAKLAPRDAAARWLNLYDRTTKLWQQSAADADARLEAEDIADLLMASLPPPAAWPELSRQIEARPPVRRDEYAVRHRALRLLGFLLHGSQKQQDVALQALRDEVATGRDIKAFGAITELVKIEALVGGASDAEGLVLRFERQLQELGEDPEETLDIPDLYRLADGGLADNLAKRAVTGIAALRLSGGKFTDTRVKQLAREHASSMQGPHFELVETEADLDLYQAMARRFPEPDPLDPTRAHAHRLLLARAVRNADADAAGDALERVLADDFVVDDAVGDVSAAIAGHLADVEWTAGHLDLLLKLLKEDPSAPLWDVATRAAIHLQKPERMLELLRDTAAEDDIMPSWADGLRQRRWELLLAIGRVDEAAALMREQLKRPHRPLEEEEEGREPYDADDINPWYYGSKSELAASLAELSKHQQQPAWLEDAIAAQKAALASAVAEEDVTEMGYIAVELARSMTLAGKSADAVAVLVDTSSKLLASDADEVESLLPDIAALYAQAGRHKDAVALLDESQDWYGTDLADQAFTVLMDGRYFGTVAAESLWKTGRKQASLRAYEYLLQIMPDAQDVHASLLSTTPAGDADVLAMLERLDAFTNGSPVVLAYLAEAQHRAGRDEAAEQTAERSLSLWPTDSIFTSEPVRHQAHRVLAAIHEARRERGHAAQHAAAVKAADLVQQAESAWAVGLRSLAIERYQQAIAAFEKWPEARAQLAILQIEQGNAAAAREQASAAAKALLKYRLSRLHRDDDIVAMLDHPMLRDAVIAVGEDQRQKDPEDANAMFLVGLAQWAGDRTAESAVSLRGVTTHDPKYLAAWDLLQLVGPTVKDRSDAALRVMTLEQDASSVRIETDEVIDLKRLWTTAESSTFMSARTVGRVYPLKATATAWGESEPRDEYDSRSIGQAIAETKLVRAIRAMMFRWPPTEL